MSYFLLVSSINTAVKNIFICLIFLQINLVIVLSFRFVFGVVLLMVQWKVWFLDMFVSESLADVDYKIW